MSDERARITRALDALTHADEVRSPISPRLLQQGTWWDQAWPDALLAGVLEARRGHRFRPENLALARLIAERAPSRVCDLGAGSGSLTFITHYLCRPEQVVAVERQSQVAARLERSIQGHGLTDSIAVACGDLREPSVLDEVAQRLDAKADLIVANPPFFPPDWGRASANEERHASTHALHGGVSAFLAAARELIDDHGTLFVVYDAGRVDEVLAAMADHAFRLASALWLPDARPDVERPTRVWLELSRGQGAAQKRL